MIPRALRPVLFAAGILLAGALPLVGRAVRSGRVDRCALDGIRIPAAPRAPLGEPGGGERLFCSVECAERWVARTGVPPERAFLTDETTGREIPAGEARLAESRVAAHAPSGCFVHVFADEAAARRHVEAFGGRMLLRPPFAATKGDSR